MLQVLLPLLTSALSMSNNEGARKAAGLVNSAASFIHKTPKKDKDKEKDR